ncbi:hypothetical protein IOC57_00175 [Bacillus sp. SD075]|uniref:hypothetical protein n=1 Tax=Bacillus sp. SD075 TaxID=2781732 RepID=UPI001A962789|nr:hypothetical protein [Bacillus sp. SD075]MBO0996178.1 hypothetical protein [Bacillus sp. SD075]
MVNELQAKQPGLLAEQETAFQEEVSPGDRLKFFCSPVKDGIIKGRTPKKGSGLHKSFSNGLAQ